MVDSLNVRLMRVGVILEGIELLAEEGRDQEGPTGGKLRRDLTGESRFPFYSSALAVHVENHLPSRLSRLQNRVKVPVSTVLGNAPCREFETANAHSEAIISFPSVG
jgi:hypothetical protein